MDYRPGLSGSLFIRPNTAPTSWCAPMFSLPGSAYLGVPQPTIGDENWEASPPARTEAIGTSPNLMGVRHQRSSASTGWDDWIQRALVSLMMIEDELQTLTSCREL